jgi:hypothetical protein
MFSCIAYMITNEVSSRVRPIISARRSSVSLPTTAADTREKERSIFFAAAAAARMLWRCLFPIRRVLSLLLLRLRYFYAGTRRARQPTTVNKT